MVAANYGLPQRNLGTVSVIGPTRDGLRDGHPLRARGGAAALALHRRRLRRELVHAARLLRGPRRAEERPGRRDQEGLPQAGARAAPGRQRARSRGRGEVQGGRRGLRGALGRRAPAPVRRLRPRGAALGRLRPELRGLRLVLGHLLGVLRRRRVRRGVRRPAATAARSRAATWSSRRRSTSPRPPTAPRSRSPTRRDVLCDHCNGNGAEPGTPIVTCSRCQGTGQLQTVARTRFGQLVRTGLCDVCGGDGRVPEQPCEVCGGRGHKVDERTRAHRRPGRHRRRPAHPRLRAAATRASAAARRATSTSSCAFARTSASCATARTS